MSTTPSTPAHKLVTSERGTTSDGRQGYAARCVVDGCGAITFGGFPSRTAARRALAGHESERPMSDPTSRIESAPTDAGTSTGARPTPTEEESNVNSIAEQSVEAGREHHAWCDRVHCVVEDQYSSHYGVAQVPTIDASSTDWRNEPEGAPEIRIRRIDFDGHAGVELSLYNRNNRLSTSGSVGLSWLTPEEALETAAILTRAAFESIHSVGSPGEDLPPTVLDADLDLSVESSDGAVVLSGEPAPDGRWTFSPGEARNLAAALLAHAADLEEYKA